ncbi:zinc-dependent alcohol dehydrogenase [Salsipaludibacter albus]|uniref:zinc-dependent alcohol dehydrogenase n=1 Tax=Salsipaludibacter albus TaxID=2849650 RepID=UPI001EE3C72D|nr:zinc-dependent alcohol dehydrogenase [Salsipaludibacter albus]MBY5161349.1 glutathione-dependent formaldehyde dehydrogenase [Salsipaludibacter albus]
MKALTWHGTRDVRVEDVPDPTIQEPTDAIVRITSTAICGSDLHLYEVLGPFLEEGDVLGHEPMGIVEEVGDRAAEHVQPGDRVVIPFNISCGECWMCERGLYAQCETTQTHAEDKGARLFGYTKLYGSVPGGQAEYLRVPMAHFGPVKVPEQHDDDRWLYLSDILPTAWQAFQFADVPKGGSVAVFGLGPVGQFCTRIARHHGIENVIGIDLVPERLEMARRHGIDVLDTTEHDDIASVVRDRTGGRGPDGVIDAVGMEAHGSPFAQAAQKATGLLPDSAAEAATEQVGVDRLAALTDAIHTVRRGGTLSIIGVYGGAADPLPMMELFDKGVQMRMGQAHVKRWVPDILEVLRDDEDHLGTADMASHHLPLDEAPRGYEIFQDKDEGATKVVLHP